MFEHNWAPIEPRLLLSSQVLKRISAVGNSASIPMNSLLRVQFQEMAMGTQIPMSQMTEVTFQIFETELQRKEYSNMGSGPDSRLIRWQLLNQHLETSESTLEAFCYG